MIHQKDRGATTSGLPTPGQLLRTVGPVVLLAVVSYSVVRGSISWAVVATCAAAVVVALGSLIWFRAAAADPPRPPSRFTPGPRLPATPLSVAAAIPVLAVILVTAGAFSGSSRSGGMHGWLDWAAAILAVVLQWSIWSLLLRAVARVATWTVLALSGRWPQRTDGGSVAS